MEKWGADSVTMPVVRGLIPPGITSTFLRMFPQHLPLPLAFPTHFPPYYFFASALSSIVNGVDIVDTNMWYFAGGTAAPAIELIYIFCKKLGIELELNMEAIAEINKRLFTIPKELSLFDSAKTFPKPFNPLEDKLPRAIDRFFNAAILASRNYRQADFLLFS